MHGRRVLCGSTAAGQQPILLADDDCEPPGLACQQPSSTPTCTWPAQPPAPLAEAESCSAGSELYWRNSCCSRRHTPGCPYSSSSASVLCSSSSSAAATAACRGLPASWCSSPSPPAAARCSRAPLTASSSDQGACAGGLHGSSCGSCGVNGQRGGPHQRAAVLQARPSGPLLAAAGSAPMAAASRATDALAGRLRQGLLSRSPAAAAPRRAACRGGAARRPGAAAAARA
jgi:hypothetical protein